MHDGRFPFFNVITPVTTFDDLPDPGAGGVASIPGGYKGLDWGMNYADAAYMYSATEDQFWYDGVVTNPYVAFNSGGGASIIRGVGGKLFEFKGAYFASLLEGTTLEIKGYDSVHNLIYTKTVTLSKSKPIWVDANFTGIAELELLNRFSVPTYEPVQFIMDNFNGRCEGLVGDTDGDGVCDSSGPNTVADNCRDFPNPSQADFDGDGVGDACDNCPKFGSSADQTDADGNGLGDVCDGGSSVDICPTPPCPTTTIQAGLPQFFDVTVRNETGNDIFTIRPDCYNVLFQLMVPGKEIEPSCRLRAPYEIGDPDNPKDVVMIPAGGSYPTFSCDLSEQYPAATLPAGLTSGTLNAYYLNYIQDPDVVPGQDITTPAGCRTLDPNLFDPPIPCTDLFMGTIRSLETPVQIFNFNNTGTLTLQADLHTVGLGKNPGSTKTPIVGMNTWVFDKKKGSCAAGYGVSWQNYPAIMANCKATSVFPDGIPTGANGQAQYNLPVGDYIVIGEYNDTGGAPIYPGVSVGSITSGSNVRKYVQVIKRADGKKLPAINYLVTGSELLVIQPEYMEWSSTAELYPFVFQSIGDWGVTTAVTPPEGFVADYPALGTQVNTEIKAVQFTVTDVGSDWVSTKVKYKIQHNGKEKLIDSKVGIKLSPELAKIKKKNIYGDEPPPKGTK